MFRFSASSTVRVRVISGRSGIFLFSSGSWDTIRTLTKYKILFHILDPLHCMLKTCCSVYYYAPCTFNPQIALSGVLCSLPWIPKLLYQGYYAPCTFHPQIALSGVLCSLPWIPKLLYSGYNAPYLESQNCSIRGIMLPTLNPQIALSGVLCSLPLRISKTKVTVSPSTLNHSYKNIPL